MCAREGQCLGPVFSSIVPRHDFLPGWLLARRWCAALIVALIGGGAALRADTPAPVNPVLLKETWPAWWIAPRAGDEHDFAVFRMRRVFELTEKPAHFIVHVSGDRRYRLYVNGQSVCDGPQRSIPMVWHFETVDLAPYLRAGKNVLAAAVWNYGEEAPFALMSLRTAFILQGDTRTEALVNTDERWRVWRDDSVSARSVDRAALHTFIVVGPDERIDGTRYPWDWKAVEFDDSAWPPARPLEHGMPQGVGTDISWWLTPRTLPAMEEKPQRLARLRRVEGTTASEKFLAGTEALTIPAHHEATLLIDQNFETNAYPRLIVSGGRGATVTLSYAEALVDADGKKGNRDEVENRRLIGRSDAFFADGGAQREFSTLLFRTFRYIELHVATENEALTIDDLYGVATGYPLREEGKFESDAADLSQIWQVGWRTARLCAYETYFDCPYYEQLQYVGDTRIQVLITLAMSGDDRLPRNAIELFDQSRLPSGLTQSRFPSISPQIIPTFSLFWTQMVRDYWWFRKDDAFVRERLSGIHGVMTWFEQRIDAKTGMLGPMPYWCFVDWPDAWPWIDSAHPGGQPPGAREGGSAILTLQYAWALNDAAELFAAYGQNAEAQHWTEVSRRLCAATLERCWSRERSLMADTGEGRTFSQHVNALAVLSGAIAGERATDLMTRVVADETLTPCTLYFRFYLLRALKKANLGDRYVAELNPWREMIARGLTTFAERPDPTRSDCHAWSASPSYELLATVCGIEPNTPGFETVRIEPHLGPLNRVHGVMPHPRGKIEVTLAREGPDLHGEITLPEGTSGIFIWAGHQIPLKAGPQQIRQK